MQNKHLWFPEKPPVSLFLEGKKQIFFFSFVVSVQLEINSYWIFFRTNKQDIWHHKNQLPGSRKCFFFHIQSREPKPVYVTALNAEQLQLCYKVEFNIHAGVSLQNPS